MHLGPSTNKSCGVVSAAFGESPTFLPFPATAPLVSEVLEIKPYFDPGICQLSLQSVSLS